MSIRPVDVPVLLQRTTEVDRVQQARDQQGQTAQQQYGLRMKAQLEEREIRVKESPQADQGGRVDPDAKRERAKQEATDKEASGRQASGGSDTADGAATRDGLSNPTTGGRIDIRI